MEIRDQFEVPIAVEEAWRVLLDVERIAPCLPGAELQEIDGDEYRGVVKVKVGPITAQYKGVARIVEADEANRRIVLSAEGRDTRGHGNATATITATLLPSDVGTSVSVETDLNVTGKVAQFGRGVMADISSKLLHQFVTCLEAHVLGSESGAGSPTPALPPARASASAPMSATLPVESGGPVDLVRVAGAALAKRAALFVGAVVAGVVVWLLVR